MHKTSIELFPRTHWRDWVDCEGYRKVIVFGKCGPGIQVILFGFKIIVKCIGLFEIDNIRGWIFGINIVCGISPKETRR